MLRSNVRVRSLPIAVICLLGAACAVPAPAPDWAAVRAELSRRVAADQELRMNQPSDEAAMMDWFHQLEAVDAENRAWLSGIVDAHGWPTISRVGAAGAHEAWLLAQHADADPDFQERCLALLRAAVPAGEADGKDLAYLEDRVAIARGREQIYGTQFQLVDGVMLPKPIADPERVDERRAAVGLGTLAEYTEQIRKVYGK